MAKKARKHTARGRKQDRARVAGGQKYEVSYDAKKTRNSASAVKKTVKKVGNSRKKVGEYADRPPSHKPEEAGGAIEIGLPRPELSEACPRVLTPLEAGSSACSMRDLFPGQNYSYRTTNR
jgi:hypothetical protein